MFYIHIKSVYVLPSHVDQLTPVQAATHAARATQTRTHVLIFMFRL